MNPTATPKIYIAICRREEAMAKLLPDEQKTDTYECMAEDLA